MNEQEPSIGWSEALGEHASNPPVSPTPSGDIVVALGQEWKVGRLENRIKAQFEQWVRKNAKASLADADGQEESESLRSAYIGDYGAGHYNWNGRYIRKALGDWPGIQYLFFLLVRRNHPEVTELQGEEIFRDNPRGCGLAIAWAQGNSVPPSVKETTGAVPTITRTNVAPQQEVRMTAEQWERMNMRVREKGPITMESMD